MFKIKSIFISIFVTAFFFILIVGCSLFTDKTKDSFIVDKKYAIGDTGPAGGLIFYINPNAATDGWTYLEAAPSDQRFKWANAFTVTGASGIDIGTGKTNTNIIVSAVGAGDYAAKKCADLVIGSYSDWFLPSKNELAQMYNNLKTKGVGGFMDANYWSSSEVDIDFAWRQDFDGGAWYDTGNKQSGQQFRAARAF
jgi:hypothetical protein